MQAVAAGVPSLILPANPDQILVAQQAQTLGVGRSLWRPGNLPINAGWQRALTPIEIRSALDHLLADPRYAQACQTLKHQLAACHGSALAAETLEGIAYAKISHENPVDLH